MGGKGYKLGLYLLFPVFLILFYSSILNISTNYFLHCSVLFPYNYQVEKQSCKQNNTYIVHLNISAVITGCNVFSTSHILCMCHCHGELSLHALRSYYTAALQQYTMCMVRIDLCMRPTQGLPHVHTLFPELCPCASVDIIPKIMLA